MINPISRILRNLTHKSGEIGWHVWTIYDMFSCELCKNQKMCQIYFTSQSKTLKRMWKFALELKRLNFKQVVVLTSGMKKFSLTCSVFYSKYQLMFDGNFCHNCIGTFNEWRANTSRWIKKKRLCSEFYVLCTAWNTG